MVDFGGAAVPAADGDDDGNGDGDGDGDGDDDDDDDDDDDTVVVGGDNDSTLGARGDYRARDWVSYISSILLREIRLWERPQLLW